MTKPQLSNCQFFCIFGGFLFQQKNGAICWEDFPLFWLFINLHRIGSDKVKMPRFFFSITINSMII